MRLAIVVDNKDGPDHGGYRVKLKLPWLSEQETTFWARIATPMAGPDRGTYVLPEIDDQVLVVFEHGDIARPIVIGALWSKKQEPVEIHSSGNNHTKLIKSRSGHRIIFDDSQGAETITIVDRTRRNKIVLDSAAGLVKIESDGDIDVSAKASVILHANAVKIGTSDAVTGKASSVLVHAAKTLGVKASRGITIGGGSTTINTSSAAACRVSGQGAGELGGAAEEAARPQVEDHQRASARGSSAGAGASPGRSAPAVATQTAADPDPEPATERVELVLVDDQDRPVPDIKLRLELADGSQCDRSTDRQGSVVIEQAPIGACKLVLDRSDLVFEHTLEVVDTGHRRPSPADPAESPGGHERRLAVIDAHRVRSGDTLEELARSAGLTWQELARFNFGTDDPAKLDGKLRVLVGCRQRSKDGAPHVFGADDQPGIVYIPGLWDRGPLPTGLTHILYVRPLRRPQRPIAFST